MSGVFVRGIGAVSPAGWGCEAMRNALARDEQPAEEKLPRPGWDKPLRVRNVPQPSGLRPYLDHPRLRRAGPLSQHGVAAAIEALGEDVARVESGEVRLGIVVCILSGVINYTRRFFEQAIHDPAKASPLIFPETVFNAPSSHFAAVLGSAGVNYTFLSDDGGFLQALGLGAQWLEEGLVTGCLIVGIEELDWLVSDALRLFSRGAVHSCGAGAVYLGSNSSGAIAELAGVTDSFSFTRRQPRDLAARKMRSQLPPGGPDELLCLSTRNISTMDRAENAAWSDWPGIRSIPKAVLGEAFTASAGWQCVSACDAIRQGRVAAVNVSVVGVSQQAIGARFLPVQRTNPN